MKRLWSTLAALLLAMVAASAQEEAAPRLPVAATPPVGFNPTPVPPPKMDGLYAGDHSSGQGFAQIAGYLILLVSLAGAGIYVLRHGIPTLRVGPKLERKLHIEETRSLGGRQFLVVAEYEGQRMLLGVCPGRIDHLCVLKTTEAPVFPKISPETEEHT